jgi:hypothetical protein
MSTRRRMPRARSPAAEKQRRFRARARNGVRVYRFPFAPDDLDFFAAARWVSEDRLGDHDAVVEGVLRELRALRERYRYR